MDARKWTLKEWNEVFFENPLMKIFAVKLIWGVYDNNGQLLNTFRYMEDGSFNNADDEEIKIDNDNLITLLSPIETDKTLIEKWKNQLADYDIIQPFYQLSLETKEELISKIPKTVTVGNIKSAVQKLGMDKDDGDGGSINYYFLHDSYNKADIFIEVSDIYYDTGNSNTTDIKIRFQNADKRFEYGAYLILSNYLK